MSSKASVVLRGAGRCNPLIEIYLFLAVHSGSEAGLTRASETPGLIIHWFISILNLLGYTVS